MARHGDSPTRGQRCRASRAQSREPAPYPRADAGGLARDAAVPRSTIANLESGEANPSLAVLVKVAQALGVPIDELLASPRAKVRQWSAEDVRETKGHGVTIRPLVPEPVPDSMMDVMDFAPGAMMGGTPHLPGTREFFTCLEGRVRWPWPATASGRCRRGTGLPRQPAALLPEPGWRGAGARRLGGDPGEGRGLARRASLIVQRERQPRTSFHELPVQRATATTVAR